MSAVIVEERPDTVDAMLLIEELEAHLSQFYPVESRHGFSVEKLINQGVAFFVTRYEGQAAGCGGIKLFDREYGEIKRMYVRPPFRGYGLGRLMLDQLAAYSQQHGVTLLRLETGVHQLEAINLYERYGFYRRPPFGDYRDDPLSIFYEMPLGGQ
ncbi:MAG: GNAT family N-acetyltransferase [Anaerolineaceae bacterium]|nr:GNAT family N-acetyltransferase [Anaerolineaceae bacterium]